MSEKIIITGEEYCNILADIIHEYYKRIISDDYIFLALNMNKISQSKFSIELSIILTTIVLRLYSIKHRSNVLNGYTRAHILERIENTVFNFEKKESENYEQLFDQRYTMFMNLIPEQKSSFQVRSQFLGFARYLISMFSEKTEEDNKAIIQEISKHIVELGDVTSKYIANGKVKTTSALTGKYEYIMKI